MTKDIPKRWSVRALDGRASLKLSPEKRNVAGSAAGGRVEFRQRRAGLPGVRAMQERDGSCSSHSLGNLLTSPPGVTCVHAHGCK
jgi:hypothetical protein